MFTGQEKLLFVWAMMLFPNGMQQLTKDSSATIRGMYDANKLIKNRISVIESEVTNKLAIYIVEEIIDSISGAFEQILPDDGHM